MGLDVQYQAMPPRCSILERARRDGKFGSHLEFFQSYITAPPSRLARYADDAVLLRFIADAKQLIQNHVGLETRNYYGGRNWDKLHFLLSEKRRKGNPQDETDWAKRAILGGDILNPQTQTTIGSPIRYLAPDETREIARRLNAISSDDLRRHWNVETMIEAAVYKIHSEDDDENFEWIKTSYQELANFYAFIVTHNEGVLTYLG